jgi:hypothetical protein
MESSNSFKSFYDGPEYRGFLETRFRAPSAIVRGSFDDPYLPKHVDSSREGESAWKPTTYNMQDLVNERLTRGLDTLLEAKTEEILWGTGTLQVLVSPYSAVQLTRAMIKTSRLIPENEVWAWNTQKQAFEVVMRFEDPFDPDDYHVALEEGAFDD